MLISSDTLADEVAVAGTDFQQPNPLALLFGGAKREGGFWLWLARARDRIPLDGLWLGPIFGRTWQLRIEEPLG